MSPRYRHTQAGWVILASVLPVAGVGAWLLAASRMAVVALVCGLFSAALALLFGWLTVEVDGEQLHARLGVGLFGRSVRLDEIRAFSAVQNPWYWGWGIRLYPGGTLYNVSGAGAVEVILRDGKRYRIGTDEPDELAAVLRAAVGEPAPLSPDEPAAQPPRASRLTYVFALLFAVAVLGAVGAAVGFSARPPTVVVTEARVSVKSGFYGVDVPLEEVVEVTLERALPRILLRTNGYAAGGSLRGHFDVERLGNGQLFVEANRPPFVFVRTTTGFFFFNDQEPARTEELHRSLVDAWTRARPR